MSIQCTTCGTQTRSGAKFCHACGTPIATAALPSTLPLGAAPPIVDTKTAPPPPVATPTAPQAAADTEAFNVSTAYLPQTPQTYNAPPPVTMNPTKKSGNGLKVVLISLALIMIIGIGMIIGAGVYFGRKAARAVDNIAKTGLPSVSNDAKGVPDDKLGDLIYPGSKREETVSGSFAGMSGGVVTFSTDDSPEEVADYYRDLFKGQKNPELNEISSGNGETVFQVNGEGGGKMVIISEGKNTSSKKQSGATEIVILLGKGIPGMPGLPPIPPPPPPPGPPGASNRNAQEMERRAKDLADKAMKQAEKAMKDVEDATKNIETPPPPKPKH